MGFSLAGAQGAKASTAAEARLAWEKALEDKGNGVILITSDAADWIRETVDQYLFSETFPLVVEIPSSGKKSADLRELVNEAIGVSL